MFPVNNRKRIENHWRCTCATKQFCSQKKLGRQSFQENRSLVSLNVDQSDKHLINILSPRIANFDGPRPTISSMITAWYIKTVRGIISLYAKSSFRPRTMLPLVFFKNATTLEVQLPWPTARREVKKFRCSWCVNGGGHKHRQGCFSGTFCAKHITCVVKENWKKQDENGGTIFSDSFSIVKMYYSIKYYLLFTSQHLLRIIEYKLLSDQTEGINSRLCSKEEKIQFDETNVGYKIVRDSYKK